MTEQAGPRRGFTLVEIAVTAAILGVLAAVSIPALSQIRTSARVRQAECDLALLHAAVDKLAWDTGLWPGNIDRSARGDKEVWDLSLASAGLLKADNGFKNWKGPYLAEVPKDPWGLNYFFDSDYRIGNDWFVVVGSFGPNRVGPNVYDSDNVLVVIEPRP